MLSKRFVFNPSYILKNDLNRIILTNSVSNSFSIFPNRSENISFSTLIHPIHAMLLSFFKGNSILQETLEEITFFFDITYEFAFDLIKKLINNHDSVIIEYDGDCFTLPPNLIIENNEYNYNLHNYTPNDFNIDPPFDFQTKRFNIPLQASILINTICKTNCIYCYADKTNLMNCSIPLSRIKEIIKEAKDLNFRNIDVLGGEIFLYKNWYDLLEELKKANYSTYLSTKLPLSNFQIKQLKELDIKEIQISIDSIFSDDLKINLGVKASYRDKILATISELDKNNISIKLKPVITNQIYNLEKLEKYIDYFKRFKHIKIIQVTSPSYSFFKTQDQFSAYKLNKDQISRLKELIYNKKIECHFELMADNMIESDFANSTSKSNKEKFNTRSMCTGNQSSFLILPNGNVTLCEKIYFNKDLILGNLLNDSIIDVWTSKKAKDLFFLSQSLFPRASACSNCEEFIDCRHGLGVCWVDVINSYGDKNWLFPSPNCPHAPSPY